MTAITQTIETLSRAGSLRAGLPVAPMLRLLAIALLATAVLAVPKGVEAATGSLADAYLAVSVFVAGTLLVLYAAERLFSTDLGAALERHQKWQVPAGALLGALPGCGGAIVAVTQFTRGTLSFGGVVATLTSTMGDAMFLLLAREPQTAVLVAVVGIVAGTLSGYVVDWIHGPRYLQPEQAPDTPTNAQRRWGLKQLRGSELAWYALFVPGLVLGVLSAFQVELESPIVAAIGVTGALLSMGMWIVRGDENRDCGENGCRTNPLAAKVIDDTNFITAWVVFAFVGYELLMQSTNIDLGAAFEGWALAVPAIAVAVGLIPGCGPQIVTTSLYLDGNIPLSAQLGNAISNDGDALFPAIAKAPKVALVATLYTMIPAILVAYGAYALGL